MTTDTIPRALALACRAVTPAAPRDAVAGVMPSWVASPASVEEASAVMRAAADHDLAVVPRGGGTKLGWGEPPRRCDVVIDMLRMDRVLEHAAGDLVTRVQAGVTMSHLAGVLGGAGQQLALDVPETGGPTRNGSPTVGGVLATGIAGPRRLRYGTPRDLVIGVTAIRADGAVTRSGGKVVKNVAGYDLGKLFAGSYGTLGLIVEAVFRLHPLPAATAFVTDDVYGAAAVAQAVAAAAGSDLAPSAVEIDRPARGGPVRVGVLLEGDPDGVAERAGQMRGALGAGSVASRSEPAWWGGAPGGTGPAGAGPGGGGHGGGGPGGGGQGGTLIRIAFWAAALGGVLEAIDAAAGAAGLDPAIAGSAAAGVLHASVRPDAPPGAVAAFLGGLREGLARGKPGAAAGEGPPARGSAVVLHAPDDVREVVDLWGPVPGLDLMRAVKDQFDPGHLMSPGRFAGGI
ncbi:MAG: glycolate oxidase binding subunit [Streptosporangiaceae bacterium]|jgi:glycolate oxidase FAD binding subunit|nr:glycolate oxidase binding subunit [Streptosporangiaceae bacterium]